jgi:hypothetical protein
MRPVIKAFDGIWDEPDEYVSPDPENDSFTLRMLIGPPDSPGLESFDVLVCTPEWLAGAVREGPQIGRHMLIVERLDLAKVEAFLRQRVEQIRGSTWSEVAEKVARIGYWELEDVRPGP